MKQNAAALTIRPKSAGPESAASSFKIFLLLSIVTLLPTSIFYVFATTSQAPGVALVALVIFGLAAFEITKHPNTQQTLAASIMIGIMSIAILSHGLVAYYLQPLDFLRMSQSLILLALMLLGAFFIRFAIFDNNDQEITHATKYIFLIFLLIGVLAILDVRPIDSVTSFNPVFPFTEPSHYALTFVPFLLFVCTNRKIAARLLILLSALAIAYLLESLSLVVGVILVGLITLPIPYLAAGAAAFAVMVSALDITYFTDRLDLSYSSSNLSVLVYLQGWELASDSVARTSGWGIGFQQLGFGQINSPTSDVIRRLAGNDANLKDGGFTLAKVTSEFGVFGFVAMLLFGLMVLRSAWVLRAIALSRRTSSKSAILAMSVICGYSIEAFVRGIGYFSGSTMLLLSAVLYVSTSRTSGIVNIAKL